MSNPISNLVSSLRPSTPVPTERAILREIDESTRAPVLFFLISGILWLLLGTVFALIASIKMHTPGFLGTEEWLTFGNIRTAHLNSVIYGWGTNAALAVALWLMARLSRNRLRHPEIVLTAACLWNLGVTIGIAGILAGDSTSIEWLEIPGYATPILFVAYALIGVWAIITFRFRQSPHIYVSQWYLIAALFWFPWLYSAAQLMLIFEPAHGTVQSLVNWWFAHNVLGLWFTPIGLAAAYYFIPKVLGKPIHSYYLSVLGFWSLALFYNWAGVHHLIGGPVPAWVISAGIVASLMMVIPIVVTGINHHATMRGSWSALKYSPTLRFIVFGALNYSATSLIGSTMAIRSVNEITHFTHFTVAHAHHGMYAFFTMVMFGSIYFMLPRILHREWPSASLISLHFWACATGIMIYVIGLSIGGVIEGLQMNDPDHYPVFLDIVKNTVPWLQLRSFSGAIISVGHIAFAVNFGWMLLKRSPDAASSPTLFSTPPAMGAKPSVS